MTDGREAVRRPARAPLRQRSRRRWGIAGGVALCWVLADFMTQSAIAATVLLVAVGGLGVAGVAGCWALRHVHVRPSGRRYGDTSLTI